MSSIKLVYNVIIIIIILLFRKRDGKVIRQDQEPKRSVLMKHNHNVTELNLMFVSEKPYRLPEKKCVCEICASSSSESLARIAFLSNKYLKVRLEMHSYTRVSIPTHCLLFLFCCNQWRRILVIHSQYFMKVGCDRRVVHFGQTQRR